MGEDVPLEVSQGLLLEGDLDLATSGDIDSLDRILTISRSGGELAPESSGANVRERYLPDVGTDDANTFEDGEEDGSLERSSSGQADGHEGPTRAEVINGLGVTRGTGSSDNCGVST